jgi:hypothetical protein
MCNPQRSRDTRPTAPSRAIRELSALSARCYNAWVKIGMQSAIRQILFLALSFAL